jgi:hypothetical protein
MAKFVGRLEEHVFKVKTLFVFAFLVIGYSANAQTPLLPNFTHYDGVLTDSAGDPITGNVTFTVKYYATGNVGCILFTESFVKNLPADGAFSLVLGSGTSIFTPSSFTDIFKNGTTHNCESSGSIMPVGGTSRMIRIAVDNGISTAIMSPDIEVGSVPYAMHASNANTLGNKNPYEFIQVNSTLNQSNLQSVFIGTNWTELQALLAGTSSYFNSAPAAGSITSTELSASAVTSVKLANDSVNSAKIVDGSVMYNDLQPMSGNTLLGRSGGSGVAQEITLGGGLSLSAGVLSVSGGGGLIPTNNLSDLTSASNARTNLGLGSAATKTAGTAANNLVELPAANMLPALNGSALTNLNAGALSTGYIPAGVLPGQLQDFDSLMCSVGQVPINLGGNWDCQTLPIPDSTEPYASKDSLRAMHMATRDPASKLTYLSNGFFDSFNESHAGLFLNTASFIIKEGLISNYPITQADTNSSGWTYNVSAFSFTANNITPQNTSMSYYLAANNMNLDSSFSIEFTPTANFSAGLFLTSFSFNPNLTNGTGQFSMNSNAPIYLEVSMGALYLRDGPSMGTILYTIPTFGNGSNIRLERSSSNNISLYVNGQHKWTSATTYPNDLRFYMANFNAGVAVNNVQIAKMSNTPGALNFEGQASGFDNGLSQFNDGRVVVFYSTSDNMPTTTAADIWVNLKENGGGFVTPGTITTGKIGSNMFMTIYPFNLNANNSGTGILRYGVNLPSTKGVYIHSIAVEAK